MVKTSKNQNEPLSLVEWETCWMAIKYAMNGRNISTVALPKLMLKAYNDRWSEIERQQIVKLLRDNLEEIEQRTGKTAYFGSEDIDHPEWMKLLLTLEKSSHKELTFRNGEKHLAIQFGKKWYPLDWYKYWNEIYYNSDLIALVG